MSKPRPKIVPFKIEHLELMDIREQERLVIEAQPEKYQALAQVGVAGTMMYDGRAICVLGYLELWEGTFEVWLIPSVYVPQYTRIFLRTIKNYLKSVAETHGVKRFQTPGVDEPNQNHWMKHLGFEDETPDGMPNYYNGQTYRMWRLLPK